MWAETPDLPQFLWAHSYLTSRQGGRGRPERLGFGSRSHILPLPRGGRAPPFVSGLAYLHINEAPVLARQEVAQATLGTGSDWELFFSSSPPGHFAPVGEGAAISTPLSGPILRGG